MAGSCDFNQLAIKLLQPAPLLIALVGQKQMAAVRADLCSAGAAAEADRAVLDRDRDSFAAPAASQVPLTLIGGQAVAMGIADVIEDHSLVLPRRWTERSAHHLQVEAQGSGGAHQDRAAHRGDIGALGNDHAVGEHLHLAGTQPCDQAFALLGRGAAAHRCGPDSRSAEGSGHLLGVLDGAAKADRGAWMQPAPVMGDGIADGGPVAKGACSLLEVKLAHPAPQFAVARPWPGEHLGPGQPALFDQPGRGGPQHQGLEIAAGLHAQPLAVESLGRGGLADQVGLRPGVDDAAPDIASHQVVGLVLNDQIRRWQLLQPSGHGLHRAHRHLPALHPVARGDHVGLLPPGPHGAGELLDQLGPMGQHQHPPALAGSTLHNRADRLALAGAGGHHGADPAMDLEGSAEIGQQLQLVVAQDDRSHGRDSRLCTEQAGSAVFNLPSLAGHA